MKSRPRKGNFESSQSSRARCSSSLRRRYGDLAAGAADDVEVQAEAAFEREAAGGGGGFDTGNGVEALSAFEGELGDGGSFLKAIAGEGHLHGEDVVGIEAGIDVAERDEGADEQRGADEEDEGEGDFADDQQGAHLALAESGAGAVAAFLQGGVEVGARGTDGGEEAEEDAGEERDGEGEEEDAPVEGDGGAVFADAGEIGGADGEQGAHADIAEDEAEDAAGDSEARCFR